MLRLAFVLSIVLAGGLLALRGPFFGLLFYIWNAYFRPEVWVWGSGADLIASLKLSYVSGAYVVVASFLWRVRHRLTLRVSLLAAFALHTLASAIVAENRGVSLAAWQEFSKGLLITYFMTVLVTDVRRLRLLLLVMALSLGLEGGREGLMQLVLNPGGINNNPIPFLGDNNGVAVGMLMLVPVLAALASTSRSAWIRRGLQVLVVGVSYRALSTYSRGGFLAAGALGILFWLRSAHKIRVLAAIAVIAAIVLPVMPDAFWERMGTINTFRETGETSALSRLHFWEVALIMAEQNPLFGVGFQGYNTSYDSYDFGGGEYGQGRSVHSAWFGVLAETGYVGLAIYVALLASAFLACRSVRRAHRDDPARAELRAYALAVETALVAFAVGGTFLPFQYNEMYLSFLGLSIVLWNLSHPRPAEAPAAMPAPAVRLAAPREVIA
jgi:probable O-glycosylation ligase (exosortase A-associated)